MITFFEGSGSKEIDLQGDALPDDVWLRLKEVARKLLIAQGHRSAADFFFEAHPFKLMQATNGFGDKFAVLYLAAPLDDYAELGQVARDWQVQSDATKAAATVGQVCKVYVRFVAMDLSESDSPNSVSTPTLETTSAVVERALADAENLIASGSAVSGVDRVHTAFHGYLRALAAKAGLAQGMGVGVTELFKLIRTEHPAFQAVIAHGEYIERILRMQASVVDSVNLLRNHGSVAHANETLLGEPEAMLVINAVRSLLHYLDARTRSSA